MNKKIKKNCLKAVITSCVLGAIPLCVVSCSSDFYMQKPYVDYNNITTNLTLDNNKQYLWPNNKKQTNGALLNWTNKFMSLTKTPQTWAEVISNDLNAYFHNICNVLDLQNNQFVTNIALQSQNKQDNDWAYNETFNLLNYNYSLDPNKKQISTLSFTLITNYNVVQVKNYNIQPATIVNDFVSVQQTYSFKEVSIAPCLVNYSNQTKPNNNTKKDKNAQYNVYGAWYFYSAKSLICQKAKVSLNKLNPNWQQFEKNYFNEYIEPVLYNPYNIGSCYIAEIKPFNNPMQQILKFSYSKKYAAQVKQVLNTYSPYIAKTSIEQPPSNKISFNKTKITKSKIPNDIETLKININVIPNVSIATKANTNAPIVVLSTYQKGTYYGKYTNQVQNIINKLKIIQTVSNSDNILHNLINKLVNEERRN